MSNTLSNTTTTSKPCCRQQNVPLVNHKLGSDLLHVVGETKIHHFTSLSQLSWVAQISLAKSSSFSGTSHGWVCGIFLVVVIDLRRDTKQHFPRHSYLQREQSSDIALLSASQSPIDFSRSENTIEKCCRPGEFGPKGSSPNFKRMCRAARPRTQVHRMNITNVLFLTYNRRTR